MRKSIITEDSIDIFKLGDHISNYKDYLINLSHDKLKFTFQNLFFIEYRLENKILLVFNILNGRLAKMSALGEFEGALFDWIRIGQPIVEVGKKFSLKYDDDENLYLIENHKTINIDLENPYQLIDENPNNKIVEITVFDKSLLYY